MKFKKSISLLLTAIMVTGCATFAASSAEMDSDSVGYSNQSYLETEAGSASATNDFGATGFNNMENMVTGGNAGKAEAVQQRLRR